MDKDTIRDRIWLIPDGIPLTLGNMTMRTTESDKLIVTGWINTVHFENISREKVMKELEVVKTSFTDLKDSFNELNNVIGRNNLNVEYHIAYDDAGKAGIGLCSEIDGKIIWYIDR